MPRKPFRCANMTGSVSFPPNISTKSGTSGARSASAEVPGQAVVAAPLWKATHGTGDRAQGTGHRAQGIRDTERTAGLPWGGRPRTLLPAAGRTGGA